MRRNVDDVVFQKMTLRNVYVDGMVYFGTVYNPDEPSVFESDEPMIMRWTENNFIQGNFNMLAHTNWRDVSAGKAYGNPVDLTPKPSGSITGIVDYRVKPVKVCVLELVYSETLQSYEECAFQAGQDSCPRRGPICEGPNVNPDIIQCGLPENPRGFNWRGHVLNDDCASDSDCGDVAEIEVNPLLAQKCRPTLVCLTGDYAGEGCLLDSHCCEKGQLTDCEHKCHGERSLKNCRHDGLVWFGLAGAGCKQGGRGKGEGGRRALLPPQQC